MRVRLSGESIVESIHAEYRRKTPRSAALFQAATSYVAGGASRSLVVYAPYPLATEGGQGGYVTDVDGNRYVDFVNCHSALVHGHGHTGVASAIVRQVERGVASSFASEEEAALARVLCERIASVEKVRFCCSGTEAGMYAVRIARAFTGKEKFLKFEGGYHGSYDDAEVSKAFHAGQGGPADAPLPVLATLGFPRTSADRVLVAPFNNQSVVARAIERYSGDLAAVLVEPVLGAGGMIPPEPGFLPFLREITHENHILLVADEVVTFRLAYGGAQELYGFHPDLTMLGKAIGGGLPVAAVGGREDLLMLSSYDLASSGASRLSLSGTFSGAAVGMAAGRASVEALDQKAIERINELGDLMRLRMRQTLRDAGVVAQVTGVGSLLQLHFTDQPVEDYRAVINSARALLAPLHLWLLLKGIAMYPRGAWNISTAITEREVSLAVDALGEGLELLKPLIRETAPSLVAD